MLNRLATSFPSLPDIRRLNADYPWLGHPLFTLVAFLALAVPALWAYHGWASRIDAERRAAAQAAATKFYCIEAGDNFTYLLKQTGFKRREDLMAMSPVEFGNMRRKCEENRARLGKTGPQWNCSAYLDPGVKIRVPATASLTNKKPCT